MTSLPDVVFPLQSLGFEASLVKDGFKNNLDHAEEIRQQVSVLKIVLEIAA